MKNRTDHLLREHKQNFIVAFLLGIGITVFMFGIGLSCLAFAYYLITVRPDLTWTVLVILTLATAAIAQMLYVYLYNKF